MSIYNRKSPDLAISWLCGRVLIDLELQTLFSANNERSINACAFIHPARDPAHPERSKNGAFDPVIRQISVMHTKHTLCVDLDLCLNIFYNLASFICN